MLLIACSLTTGSVAIGQQQKEQFAQAQKANAGALRQYSWKTRTEIKLKGESKSVKLDQERYDIDGKIEKTPLQDAPAQPAESETGGGGRRGGRLKEKVVEKKKDELADLMQNLGQLVASYAHMPPDKTQPFAQNAHHNAGTGPATRPATHPRKERAPVGRHDERLGSTPRAT